LPADIHLVNTNSKATIQSQAIALQTLFANHPLQNYEFTWFYSGHGSERMILTCQEWTGVQQMFVFGNDQVMWDTEFNEWLSTLTSNVTALVITDMCYSGTITNCPYTWNPLSNTMNQLSISRPLAATIVAVASCRDEQYSYSGTDTSLFTGTLLELLSSHANTTISLRNVVMLLRIAFQSYIMEGMLMIPLFSCSQESLMTAGWKL
jgi:hypothetical protein